MGNFNKNEINRIYKEALEPYELIEIKKYIKKNIKKRAKDGHSYLFINTREVPYFYKTYLNCIVEWLTSLGFEILIDKLDEKILMINWD